MRKVTITIRDEHGGTLAEREVVIPESPQILDEALAVCRRVVNHHRQITSSFQGIVDAARAVLAKVGEEDPPEPRLPTPWDRKQP